eukprot:TRINITY_DN7993_c0_g1_i1.p1 TRINITY_DN7993_c0_g1~~TRINITY_DN7993_c0_g1_i1.p1  ORF type:complete len:462 (+),score=68.78 TRINITY_DN7993_c0_g1_i1:57-1442(+)
MDDTESGQTCGDIPPEILKQQEIRASTKSSQTCVKCKEQPSILIYRKESVCWVCFQAIASRKFKQGLSGGNRNPVSEHLCVGFSGGPSSCALLGLLAPVAERRVATQYVDVSLHVSVVFVDEGAVLGTPDDQRQANVAAISSIVNSYGFPLSVIQLESCFDLHSTPSELGACVAQAGSAARLAEFMSSIKSNTSKEDAVEHLRTQLLLAAAKRLRADKLVLGSCATRLATTLISSTSKGRGFNVPQEVAGMSSVDGVMVCRPLHEFLANEIAVFNRHKGLEAVFLPTLATAAQPKFSINHLTEGFVNQLQLEYSHTVPTLLRSGSKLSTPDAAVAAGLQCCVCSCLLPTSPSSVAAAASAPSVASPPPAASVADENSQSGCGSDACCRAASDVASVSGCCSSATPRPSASAVDHACYACRTLLADCNPSRLPEFVARRAASGDSSSRLREQISEFLLDDDE